MSSAPPTPPSRPKLPESVSGGGAAAANDTDEVAELTVEQMLAAYIDWQTRHNFTDEARAAVLSEAREYIRDVCRLTRICQRGQNAEKALQSYVAESASFLRNRTRNPTAVIADWCKWVGFAFLGFAVQQFLSIQHEKPIDSGSVTWLVIDVAITAVLISAGFAIERPLHNILRWRKDRSP